MLNSSENNEGSVLKANELMSNVAMPTKSVIITYKT